MIKKLLLLGSLSLCAGAQAVLLKDGSSVPQKKVDRVYDTLKNLYHAHPLLLADLVTSCRNNNRTLVCQARHIVEMNPGEKFKKRFEQAVALDLCDKDGIIDQETAHIVASSINCWFKTPSLPIYIKVHSPISWLWWTEIFKKASKK